MSPLTILLRFAMAAFPLGAIAADVCTLSAPPKEAAVGSDDGALYFVHPRSLPAAYSGCQAMWDERGRRTALLRFEAGVLSSYESTEYGAAAKTRACRYGADKAANEGCPAYDEVSHGLPAAPVGEEPAVPNDRDPRK